METVLLILKIAGIILAAVLGILIAGLFCVLFVPVRYRGDFYAAGADEPEKRTMSASFRAAWLLWLVRVYVSYEESVRVRIKLLFFTLMDTAGEKRERGRKKKSKENRKNTDKAKQEEKTEEKAAESTSDRNAISEGADEREKRAEQAGEKKGIKRRIFNILQTIRDFCDKLRRAKEKTERFLEIWSGEHMVNSRSLLGRELRYLLRHSKPGKLTGYLRFGFEDPSTTGYAMALYYGLIYPIWCPKLSVEPDFERQVLDCRIQIKGKIRTWHFLKSGLKLFFSKDIRRVTEDIRKL